MMRNHVLPERGGRTTMRSSRRLGIAAAVILAATLPTSGLAFRGSAGHADVKQLVIDTQYDQRTADPGRDSSFSGRYIMGSAYDTLTTFKPRLVNGKLTVDLSKPQPWLATSWSASRNGRVWTFQLRKGVKFSNGDPLTSADVVFSLLRVKNLNAAAAFAAKNFTSVTARGPYAVSILTDAPNPAVPYLLTVKGTGIVDAKVAQQNGATDAADASLTDKAQPFFDTHSIGSGPYMIQQWSNSGTSVLVRNPNFWGPTPNYDRIVFQNVKSEVARLDVQSGQADISLGLTPDQARGISGAKVLVAPSIDEFYLQANANSSVSSLASNPNLWQAIRYGLDYPRLIQLAGGGAVQACGVIPRQFVGALLKSACIKRNIARAKAALAKTGVSNPSLTLEFPTDFTLDGVSFQTLAEAEQSMLQQIGLNVTLQGAPLATWLPRWQKGIQQLNQGAYGPQYPETSATSAYLPTGYRGQYAGYSPTDRPDLVALATKAQQTFNTSKRAALYRQLQVKMNSSTPFIPQFQPSLVIVARSNVGNVVINPAFVIDPNVLR